MDNLIPTIARSSFFSTLGKLSVKIISFAFTIFIIRWLGDAEYGQYTLIWSYVTIFAMFSDAGLNMYALREIAQKNPQSQYIAGNITVIRLILAGLTMVLLIVTARLLNYPERFQLYVLLASIILLLYAVQDTLDTVLQAHERFDLAALAIVAGQLVFVVVGAVLLIAGWHITGLIIAALLNVLVSAVLAWYLLADYSPSLRWHIKPAWWPGFIQASVWFGLIKLGLSWSLKIDIVILSWFWLDKMVGWYGAAYAIVLGVVVISNSVNAALYPTLSRQYAQQPANMLQIYQLVLKYLLLLSLPIAGGVFLTADKWVTLLYGMDFGPTAAALKILIWVIPLTFTSEFLRYALLATAQERAAGWGLAGAILFNLIFNLWLIPHYGLLAAAFIAVVTEALLVIFYGRQLFAAPKSLDWGQVLLKPLLATLILMAIIKLAAPISLPGQLLLGVIIYAGSIWKLGIVNADEYKLVLNLFQRTRERLSMFAVNKTVESSPLVSVFIPAYNADRFLSQAIDSVLAQTYQNYELIIVDDGSTDHTADILKRYQADPRITIHRHPENRGMATAWNVGLSLSQGELIAKLDADDFYEPDYLASMVDFFQKHQQVGLVFSGLNLIYADGRREPEMRFLRSWVREREQFLPTLLHLCVIRSPTVCVRRACYDQLGDFVEQMRIHADWEMWVRIAANYPVGFVAHRLANYRVSYGLNITAQAAIDGRSMQDLQLWLKLLENNELPYQLSETEWNIFRWGIYEIEMHFAAMAAFNNNPTMQKTYTAFAEQLLPTHLPSSEMERMRRVYTSLHQGICAFREYQLKEARGYFLQAIKTGPKYCKPFWIWNKLLLTFIGKTKWGIMYK